MITVQTKDGVTRRKHTGDKVVVIRTADEVIIAVIEGADVTETTQSMTEFTTLEDAWEWIRSTGRVCAPGVEEGG